MKLKNIILYIVVMLVSYAGMAQSVIGTAAISHDNGSVSLSWSVGETIIETQDHGGAYLTQGFLQPASIIVTSINEPISNSGISLYPNPATNSITLVHNNYQTVKYQMFDGLGNLLKTNSPVSGNIEVDISAYATGIYYMQVYDKSDNLIKTLKIDKVK